MLMLGDATAIALELTSLSPHPQIKSPSDLASVARTSRIHHFLSIPLLYHTVSLRRPSRRPRAGKKYMALSALMKPGIAACVKVLEIVGEDEEERDRDAEDEWWERAQWSDEDTVWAVAVAGVLAGCTRLETFWWVLIFFFFFIYIYRIPSLMSPGRKNDNAVVVCGALPIEC